MTEIEKIFSIKNKKVTVIYDFTFYSEKEYKNDYKDFIAYQIKKEKVSKPDEIDWKFLNLKEYSPISFKDFLEITSNLLTKVIAQILKENPSIMCSDQNEFKVRIILFRVAGRAWYMEEQLKMEMKGEKYEEFLEMLESDKAEHAEYLTAGIFLIQNVAAPWFYKKRINYSYIYRFLVHELEHHKQIMADFFKYENEIVKKLKIKVQKIPNYRVTYVFMTVHQLLNEGIADFATISNRPKIDIHMDWIRKFRKDLKKITTMTGKNKVHEFWVDKLSYGVYAGGAYYCGKIMCFTIEMAFAKTMKKGPFIYTPDGKTFSLGAIDEVMSKHKVFDVTNPEYSVYRKAYDEITKNRYDYIKFIDLYEWACKELGIKEKNMIIWHGLYDDLLKKATKFYDDYSKKQKVEMYKKVKQIVRSGSI